MEAALHTLALAIAMLSTPLLIPDFLVRIPALSVLFVVVAVILFWRARRRYSHTARTRNLGADERNVYFNPNVPVIAKLMFLDQTAGITLMIAALGYLAMAALWIAIWWQK